MMEFLDTEISIALVIGGILGFIGWACLTIVIVYIIADICKIGEDEYEAHKARKGKK